MKRKTKELHPELNFTPPSKAFARQFIEPFKRYFRPEFFGIDDVDVSRPAMYVSNHAVLGVLDVYPFAIELYLRKGVILRALADRNHFKIPFWRDLLMHRIGVVEASRENCAAIMERGENLVVFPGGTREVCKKKGHAYELNWSDRSGFVRMAMQYGYDIIPVAAVGAEEAYTIVKDADEILHETFIGKFLKFSGLAHSLFKDGELLPPQVQGVAGTLLPHREKLYFSFGPRIVTGGFQELFDDKQAQDLIKAKVQLSLLTQFNLLFEQKDRDALDS